MRHCQNWTVKFDKAPVIHQIRQGFPGQTFALYGMCAYNNNMCDVM